MLPKLNSKDNKTTYLKAFSGLDKREKISDSSFGDMRNMTADSMPAIASREGRQLIATVSGATEICTPEYTSGGLSSFTGVMGNKFYYMGSSISGTLSSGKKSIADFNGKICIFPDKVYYDYQNGDSELKQMERMCKITGASFHSSTNSITGAYSSYITASGANFNQYFSVGDSIVISGCTEDKNNTKTAPERKNSISDDGIISVVCEAVSASRIDVVMYNQRGEKKGFVNKTESLYVTFKNAIPDMDNICVHNNRLWGTASNGDYIYASKLGDFTNFNSFRGLSDDSWFSYIATKGPFTGICSYRSSVVAFKRDCIHHIYGDLPTNFSIPKQVSGGCIDGKSICEIEGILYFLSYNGFSAYGGGEPYSISYQLTEKYSACAAGTDGRHYYASSVKPDGSYDVLVYNPETNIWVKEDNAPFVGFCTYDGVLYGIADGNMWRLCGGEENVSWCIVSKDFNYDMTEFKGVSDIRIRMKLNGRADISLSFDGDDFFSCGSVTGDGKYKVYRVPVRFEKCESFRIMVEGTGKAVISDIEIIAYLGGKVYG